VSRFLQLCQDVDVFSSEERDGVRDRVLEIASSDSRVVGGAVLGSLAHGGGDRWSDLDLMFAVADGVPLTEVLEQWTETLARELGAVQLFDLVSGPAIYRVFLLPGCLQFDLSLTPASEFGARGPKFRVLFGETAEKPYAESPSSAELFGYAVHHAVRARFCIERGRWWQAEYWISGVRDYALALACRRRGLEDSHGRGFDELPVEVLHAFSGAIVRSVAQEELLRALAAAIRGLLRESGDAQDVAARVEPQLRELSAA
jgi:hypothetical protein